MDVIDFLLRAVGAFYVLAGYLATRAAVMSLFLDRAIAAIAAEKPSRKDVAQSYWLIAAAALVLAGGAALVVSLDIAAWLFIASAIGQAAYLFYVAPRFFDDDDTDAAGRRQTTNAFILYLLATALVVWAFSSGRLQSWQDAGWPALAVAGGLVAAHLVYVAWSLSKVPPASPFASFATPDDGRDPSECTRIKVMAEHDTHPLWALDEDLYGDFPPERLGLSQELTDDLNAWAEAFTSSLNREDPAESLWSDEQHKAHQAMARPLAVRLAREMPDRTIFVMSEVGVVEVSADEDLPPTEGGARA